ncbi:BZ3500_MvSof-1268-A1-R1_Chr11-1g03249 [Microbotryum saponariae]|uniref:BZ3500_MvSof-1268-A1-R1_Chr11-1g03249 protein n=1 Tax=Microbotryum saponariae TaxID=289078 RepID=A0A2X0M1X4_9BASI|nr:BZ3501_MvSof-1269-A2-R1_Chr11g02824 [Microbotryum saponariae]SDA03812.1 BZ3500_MvSof-1268-A1-R1_Chr11-1g03249 [Microbotryum saponariae]
MLSKLRNVSVAAALLFAGLAIAAPTPVSKSSLEARHGKQNLLTPKVMIISMFAPERAVWIKPMKLVHNVSVVGLSPLYPYVACNDEYDVCIMTTGEAEINAAASMMALALSPLFCLQQTYFLIAGIGGVNPYAGTLGSAAFARFAVQVALEYELDARQMPSNWTTGYWMQNTAGPGQLSATKDLYGTELFEVNTNLLAKAYNAAKGVTLNDSTTAQAYRQKFDYAPANQSPQVILGDVATSDVYYAGTLLSESFGNYTALLTNGTGKYTTTAQEDNATLESMVRATKAGLLDYARVIILRTCSDFDRAPPGNVTAYDAFVADQGGFEPALQNLYIAGKPVVDMILKDWSTFKNGVQPQSKGNGSYYGDDLGTLRSGPALA